MDDESQALLLFTNRLLLDILSIAVDSGQIGRANLEKIIDFSAREVARGAPNLTTHVDFYASVTKGRLPNLP